MALNPYMPQQMYGQYNALAPYQQQLANMQQQYTQYQAPQMQQAAQPSYSGIKGKPVTGEEEAKNTIIDMDGSVFVFPDIQNGKVYTKQMNPETFASIFRVYKLDDATQSIPTPSQIDMTQFAKQEEVENIKGTISSIQSMIDALISQPASFAQSVSKRANKEEVK